MANFKQIMTENKNKEAQKLAKVKPPKKEDKPLEDRLWETKSIYSGTGGKY